MSWTARTGIWICLAAVAALGALEAAYGSALPGLHAYPEFAPDWAPRASGVLLVLASAAALFRGLGASLLAVHWAVALAFALIAAAGAPDDILGYVPAAEAAAFVTFALWLLDKSRAWLVLRIVFGAMLVLFGAIHLTHREMIASLIPVWLPGGDYWPWLTGGGSVLAGLACVSGRGVTVAAGAVAVMYALWLPLVHAPRLMADPASLFEWTFALTAFALAGVALAIAGYAPVAMAVSGRPPHSAQEPS